MYQDFYGLRERPFELTSNHRFLLMTPKHREALSTLEYGLFSAKALTLLIGEAGTGKTTLLQAALQSERCRNVRCVYVNNPSLTRQEFIELLARAFQLPVDAHRSKTAVLEELESALRQRRSHGEITALVLDEAQGLSIELLEEVRLLGNIETSDEKLLPLVLAGQPELDSRLEHPSFRQLKQRVSLRSVLGPLELSETAAYIAHRIRTAGGVPSQLFTRESVALIHECSSGIPRTISVICDNALVSGFALDRRPVDRSTVLEVCNEFRLRRQDRPPPISDRDPNRDQAVRDTESEPANEPVSEAAPQAKLSRFRRFGSFGLGRS
jgi:type II secretory pathway predicted ATPase ExeA